MDDRERYDNLTEVVRTGVRRGLANTWTAMPVHVLEDSDGFVVKIQPTIQGRVSDLQGNARDIDMPHLGDMCPVQYSSGGGFTITHPIKAGDEGIAVFASRCIDGWWDKGGVQKQAWGRMHDLSDAMYIPGIRSKPRRLGGNPDAQAAQPANGRDRSARAGNGTRPVSTNSVQIRTDAGTAYIELDADGVVNIYAPGGVNIHAPTAKFDGQSVDGGGGNCSVTITGPLHVTEDITAVGEVTARSGSTTHLSTHTHGGVQGGTGTSGPPSGSGGGGGNGGGGGGAVVGPNAPTNPATGIFWWNPATKRLSIWEGGQWNDVTNVAVDGVSVLGNGQLTGAIPETGPLQAGIIHGGTF
jgi:hypothetical protein